MPINLKSFIEDESAVKNGGFSGAVFLSYTLNLGFFEQIILPALERAGCSNVLIICDPDGYAEAMDMGLRNVVYAGLRYVCTPLPRKGYGVQHVKMLLMAGANQGRLLIGSGNLTLHGYSRNLEIFSRFEFDPKNPDPDAKQAFHSVWDLLRDLSQNERFSSSAHRQLDVISANACWLLDQTSNSDSFYVWNNFHSSIWSQVMDWRKKSGLLNSPVKALKIFSPYYDQDSGMLRKFSETLLPNEVNLYVSRENTTLNGQALFDNWPKDFPHPQLYDIRESRANQSQRLLHGKLIVGIEEAGSWCIAGSANITRAAFENSWQNGSNLEMVTFRWSPDPAAFNYLFVDPISITPIAINSLNNAQLTTNSENPRRVTEETILVTELTLNNKILTGRLSQWWVIDDDKAELIFLRSGLKYSIKIDRDLRFKIPFTDDIRTSESAFVRGGGIESLPCWIDIPAILQEYGSRSYHERIQAKLDTVVGAEGLFHELMEFLFDRAIPDQSFSQDHRRSSQRTKNDNSDDEETDDSSPAPDIERFVVPERDPSGLFQIGKYTRLPYNHNIRSLRDLLSIVLLRLTSNPIDSTEAIVDEDSWRSQGEEGIPEGTDNEEGQINARQRLCSYLIDYCKRNSKRLCDINFIEKITPEILLDNHLTLSRVLLEFNSHVIEFGPDDFARSTWLIWAPLFSPSIVGIDEKSTWQIFEDRGMKTDFIETWNKMDLLSLLIVMTSVALGQPPSWPSGLHMPKAVSKFLAMKDMLHKVNFYLPYNVNELSNPISFGIQKVNWDECVNTFSRILEYIAPARERLTPLFEWIENTNDQTKQSEIIDQINKEKLTAELESYKKQPKRIVGILTEPDDEGLIYCPRCGGSLLTTAIAELNRGKLVLCSTNSDTWLFKTEEPSNLVI